MKIVRGTEKGGGGGEKGKGPNLTGIICTIDLLFSTAKDQVICPTLQCHFLHTPQGGIELFLLHTSTRQNLFPVWRLRTILWLVINAGGEIEPLGLAQAWVLMKYERSHQKQTLVLFL